MWIPEFYSVLKRGSPYQPNVENYLVALQTSGNNAEISLVTDDCFQITCPHARHDWESLASFRSSTRV